MSDRVYRNLMVLEVVLVWLTLFFAVMGYGALVFAMFVSIGVLFWIIIGVPLDMGFDALRDLDVLESQRQNRT